MDSADTAANAAGSGTASDASQAAGVRWWPAAVIVAAGLVTLAVVRGPLFPDPGISNLATQSLAALVALLLLGWAVFFSRFPHWLRRRIFLAAMCALIGAAMLLRLEGLSGDLWLDFRPRWRPRPAAATATVHEVIDLARTTPDDFPRFLGPLGNGTLPGAKLATDWSAKPPRKVWEIAVGEAWSGFAVQGDFAITQELRPDADGVSREAVCCYRLATGKPCWTFLDPTSAAFVSGLAGNGPRATPTITGERVIALGAAGALICLRGSDGTVLWQRNTLKDASAEQIHWGQSGSPLVVGERVIVAAGGKQGHTLMAYSLSDGNLLWHGGNDLCSYATPVLATLAGRQQIVSMNRQSITGHDLETGAVLWQFPWENPEPNVANPLVVSGERVFVSSGYGWGCALLKPTPAAERGGAWTVAEVWRNKELKAKFTNVVEHEGALFGLDEKILCCLDLETGKRRWKAGRYGHGQLLLAGDKLLIQAEEGEVVLVAANPARHEELGRAAALDGKTWNNPALAGRWLVTRNDRQAVCLDVGE